MAINFPQWADPKLSAELPSVRAAGESPTVEFKEQFPDQAHRLAQELAALGTSGGGILYIGISDNGDLVGIRILQHEYGKRYPIASGGWPYCAHAGQQY
jgi:predicted HTH transcriptional regulator